MTSPARPRPPRPGSRGARTPPGGTRRVGIAAGRPGERTARRTPGHGVERPRTAAIGSGGGSSAVAAVTWKAAVLIVVILLALAVVLPTLRAYLRQQEQAAALEGELVQAQNEVEHFEAELARWEDPAYVIAQARERLSYVFPGERPFRVVDPEFVTSVDPVTGEPVANGDGPSVESWFDTLWGSVTASR